MLDQLFYYWRAYDAFAWSPEKLRVEVAAWLSQHSVEADDFAFSIGCALNAFACERA